MMIQEAVSRYLESRPQTGLAPKAVLFDMDGVLYDSMRFHARAWKEVADEYRLDSCLQDFYLFEGRTGASTIDVLFQRTFGRHATPEEKKEIYAKKAARFHQYNDGNPMPGAKEVIAKVKAHHLQPVLVTGSAQHSLIAKLQHSYPATFEEDKMVTGDSVKYGKPHPEPYQMGLQKAGVAASEAFVIENAPLGVESAVAAGIFTIAVNTGPLEDGVLLEAGANLLYPDMQRLADDWDRIMQVIASFTPAP